MKQNWTYVGRRRGGDEKIYICPQCGKPKLEHNQATRIFSCWSCRYGGRTRSESSGDPSLYKKQHRFTPKRKPPTLSPLSNNATSILPTQFQARGLNLNIWKNKVYVAPDSKYFDRVLFIWRHSTDVCSYTAYALISDEGSPKSIRIMLTEDKGVLYFHQNSKALYVVEGEVDAMSIFECGFSVAALGGKEVTSEQITNLTFEFHKRKYKRMVICLDGGELAATKRLCFNFRRYLSRQHIWVCLLPDKKDPNDVYVNHESYLFSKIIPITQIFEGVKHEGYLS